MQIGIDIGSVSISAIFLKEGEVVNKQYLSHKGDIQGCLKKIFDGFSEEKAQICITGKDVKSHSDILHLDPVVALIDGAKKLFPEVRNILYVGGESYTLIHVKEGRLQNYRTNSSCASGTGAFLEQQASRLGMDIANFALCAAGYKETPPRVATRCAVFAKSDIIHLQQEGVKVEAIAAGLCDSLVDGLWESLLKGHRLKGVTVLAGGVFLNPRIVQTVAPHIESMSIHELSCVLGAYGAALYAHKAKEVHTSNLLECTIEKEENTRLPLQILNSNYPDFNSYVTEIQNNTEVTIYEEVIHSDVYLGIDIGSTSTKAVLTSPDGNILIGFYTRTAGKPVDAVKAILKCIQEYSEKKKIALHFLGVATTGSGRKLIKNILHADCEVNEITAHAKAAMFLYPQVDTIIEIGGQDAKFTRMENGAVSNAVMNYVCAAGTGSFIEEQCKRLNVELKDFSDLAMKGIAPITSERCTVYMERDINRLIRQGWRTQDIAASVIYSVRDNYLNKVVAGASLGNHVIFQGATARNKALVAAFEQYLQKEIKVFPFAHLTGALGVCLFLKEKGTTVSSFKGLSFIETPVTLATEFCDLCNNHCRMTVIESPEGKEAYGMMCGRDYAEKRYIPVKSENFNFLECYKDKKMQRGSVLIPCALVMYEYMVLWKSFFQRLNFSVKVIKTDNKSFEEGKQIAQAEFCAPLLTAQGLLWDAMQQKADMIFFPIFYKEENQEYTEPFSAEGTPCFFCYYTSHLPAIIRARLPKEKQDKLVSPLLEMDKPEEEIIKELFLALKNYEVEQQEISWAYQKAKEDYLAWKKENLEKGRQELAKKDKKDIRLVILGRPYNTFDPVMNASLVEKIVKLGYPTVYYDMLDIPDEMGKDPLITHIHWNYGKKIYRAAKYIAESDNLFPIYLTSFRCSPDAFIMTYFKHLMDHFKKPYLIIQLDEHCSDVGYLTRVEAAIDSFKGWKKSEISAPSFDLTTTDVSLDKTILIPHVDEIAGRLVAAIFQSYGYKAIVLEESSLSIERGFRHSLGGECLAIPAIIGGVIRAIEKQQIDPDKALLFLPTSYISCNFPQFPVKISLALEKAGMPIKVINTSSFNLFKRLLFKMDLVLWDALIVADCLRRLGCALRPYEVNKGETDKKTEEAVSIMEKTIADKKSQGPAWQKVVDLFSSIPVQRKDRPRILITGDVYVKNNDAFNQNIVRKIEELGGEAFLSTSIEYFHYGLELDRYKNESNLTQMAGYYIFNKILENSEQFYYGPIAHLLPKIQEPSWETMFASLNELGIQVKIQGETAITVSRAICLARVGAIQGVVHINPSFCCAGNVSISLLEKIREECNVPVIHIFYDGTDQPNSNLVPFMHYLSQSTQEIKL